jgi:hypothetical protein
VDITYDVPYISYTAVYVTCTLSYTPYVDFWPVHLQGADTTSIKGIMSWMGKQPVFSCVSTRHVFILSSQDSLPVWACASQLFGSNMVHHIRVGSSTSGFFPEIPSLFQKTFQKPCLSFTNCMDRVYLESK